MGKRVTSSGKVYHSCTECGFAYRTKELAQKCQDWCREHHSCSLEITKHAVNLAKQQ